MPADLITHDFRTPPGWGSGHLQTVRSRVRRPKFELARVGSQRGLLVGLDDGTGDRLAVQVHRARQSLGDRYRLGLVVLVHGLGGSAESDYVRATTFGLLQAGFNVARVDLRSAGRSVLTSAQMYHAGRTEDLRAVLRRLSELPEARDNVWLSPRLAIMGFSLGAAASLKLLGEPLEGLPLFGGVAVSAPLDLLVGSEHLSGMAFGVYERYLLRALRRDSTEPTPDQNPRLTERERELVARARTLADFDDAVTAPRNGWRDATEYYAVNSCNQYLPAITTPTLVIHAVDDPMIPISPYLAVDWQQLETRGAIQRAITPRGGHVGFHEHGNPLPWYVGQAVAFLRPLAGRALPPGVGTT